MLVNGEQGSSLFVIHTHSKLGPCLKDKNCSITFIKQELFFFFETLKHTTFHNRVRTSRFKSHVSKPDKLMKACHFVQESTVNQKSPNRHQKHCHGKYYHLKDEGI